MRIVIMMRVVDQDSGLRAYAENLVETLLQIDPEDDFLLFYRKKKHLGRFASCTNAREIFIGASHKFIWDQAAVPYRAWKEEADIIFNPKFSVPLFSHCPVAMGLQEPAWWTWPEHYEWFDRHYMRTMLPLYCRKASHIFPMSNFILEENRKVLGLPLEHVTVSWAGPDGHFKRMADPAELDDIRKRHRLPRKFILSVTRVLHAGLERSSSYHPGKNPETTLRAFLLCRGEIPHKLVFAGRRVRDYLLHAGFRNDDFEDVFFLDFVPHSDLAGIYNLADLFVIPSYYEGFGFTLLEAMACGCPAIASRTGACPEVSDGAAILANPYDPADFANKIRLAIKDETLRDQLRRKGLERAASFDWKRTAGAILGGLKQAVQNHKKHKRISLGANFSGKSS